LQEIRKQISHRLPIIRRERARQRRRTFLRPSTFQKPLAQDTGAAAEATFLHAARCEHSKEDVAFRELVPSTAASIHAADRSANPYLRTKADQRVEALLSAMEQKLFKLVFSSLVQAYHFTIEHGC
jgi:hypothetical protein